MIQNPIALVGVSGNGRISIMPVGGRLSDMSREQAVDLAVRLVALADDYDNPTFGKLLREFMNQ